MTWNPRNKNKHRRCQELIKKRVKVWPSAYASGQVVQCYYDRGSFKHKPIKEWRGGLTRPIELNLKSTSYGYRQNFMVQDVPYWIEFSREQPMPQYPMVYDVSFYRGDGQPALLRNSVPRPDVSSRVFSLVARYLVTFIKKMSPDAVVINAEPELGRIYQRMLPVIVKDIGWLLNHDGENFILHKNQIKETRMGDVVSFPTKKIKKQNQDRLAKTRELIRLSQQAVDSIQSLYIMPEIRTPHGYARNGNLQQIMRAVLDKDPQSGNVIRLHYHAIHQRLEHIMEYLSQVYDDLSQHVPVSGTEHYVLQHLGNEMHRVGVYMNRLEQARLDERNNQQERLMQQLQQIADRHREPIALIKNMFKEAVAWSRYKGVGNPEQTVIRNLMNDFNYYQNLAMTESLDGWFDEQWVDISRTLKDGSHPPCGDSAGKGRRAKNHDHAYPKCVPKKRADSMTADEKRRLTQRKRHSHLSSDDKSKPANSNSKL